MSQPLYHRGLNPRCLLDKTVGGPQSQFGRHEELKILPTPGVELRSLRRPAPSQSIYQLRYPGS
jgi:hypothetical protein